MSAAREDAVQVLERVQRILQAVSDHAQIMETINPEYARGVRFAYGQAAHVIGNEIGYINQDRAARAAIQGDK